MRLALWVAYNGSNFRGFAPNPDVPTVDGLISNALRIIWQADPPPLTCAGRTDKGVHGRGQVVTLDVPAGVEVTDLAAFERSLNGLCRPDVVVWHVVEVPSSFDARFSAKARTYRYHLLNQRLPDPLLQRRVWHVWEPINWDLAAQALEPLVGTYDFSSFCRRKMIRTNDGEAEATRVRTLQSAAWVPSTEQANLKVLHITATSFCQQMVRSIVGLSIDVGQGRIAVADVARVRDAQDRRAIPTVAPPDGLVLWEVGYDPDEQVAFPVPDC